MATLLVFWKFIDGSFSMVAYLRRLYNISEFKKADKDWPCKAPSSENMKTRYLLIWLTSAVSLRAKALLNYFVQQGTLSHNSIRKVFVLVTPLKRSIWFRVSLQIFVWLLHPFSEWTLCKLPHKNLRSPQPWFFVSQDELKWLLE